MSCIYPDQVGEHNLVQLIQEFVYKQQHPGSSAQDIPDLPPFFSFTLNGVKYLCALVHWFSRTTDMPSNVTGMHTVEPNYLPNGKPTTAIVHLGTVFRAAHLLPIFSNHLALTKRQRHEQTLDLFSEFYVNRYIDHHAFEVVS